MGKPANSSLKEDFFHIIPLLQFFCVRCLVTL